MRSIARLPVVLLSVVVLCLAAASARAQSLPGDFATHADFIIGAWKWERTEPRQTVWMRFERDGSFHFNNLTIALQHWGTYSATSGQIHITVNRSCNNQSCENRSPPLNLNYPFNATEADVFTSGAERWERQRQ